MYQFSGKLKTLAIAFIILGAMGIGYGFYAAPKTVEEATAMLANAHDTHGDAHAVSTASHDEATAHDAHETSVADSHEVVAHDAHDGEDAHAPVVHEAAHDDAHAVHVFHQMQNRPWAALYVALFFFLGITLLVLAFYAIQRVAQAGWSIVLFRVMEAITANLHYVSVFMLLFLLATFLHKNHLFSWMAAGVVDPTAANFDPIIFGKKMWLNTPGWLLRSIVYLAGWNAYRFFIRRSSIAEDKDASLHKKNYNVSVGFLAFFMITESMMSWDWIMGLDPHWFSTLFGWYILATFMVCAVTVIAFVTIYLRSKGHLPMVNDSHIHDLTKFMFGFSVFWTYLWFAQFMLIWYADMPEETTYFLMRFNEYKLPFLGMVAMNFFFPILLLINSDFKSIPWFIVIGGIVILTGHYVDVFVMIMPATVGAHWGIGIPEISAVLFFLGIFIYATFSAFAKADPIATGNPYLRESEEFHYYNIEHRGEENHH